MSTAEKRREEIKLFSRFTGETININTLRANFEDEASTYFVNYSLKKDKFTLFKDLYDFINDTNLREFFENPDTLDGFFELNEQYGKGVEQIQPLSNIELKLHNILESQLTTDNLYKNNDLNEAKYDEINASEMLNPFWATLVYFNKLSYDGEKTIDMRDGGIPKFVAYTPVEEKVIDGRKVLVKGKLVRENRNCLSSLLLGKILVLKIMGAYIISNCSKDKNAYNRLKERLNQPELAYQVIINNTPTTLPNNITKPKELLKYAIYDDLTNSTKAIIRSITFNDIYDCILEYDTQIYGKYILTVPLNIFHSGNTCGHIAFVNGYRGILFNYFNNLGRELAYTELITNFIRSIPNKAIFIKDVIKNALSGEKSFMKVLYDKELDMANTLNDSRFLLLVVSAFLNLPTLTLLNMAYFMSRAAFGDFYKYYKEELSNEATFDYSLMKYQDSGYIYPIIPYTLNYDKEYDDYNSDGILNITDIIGDDQFKRDMLYDARSSIIPPNKWTQTNQLYAFGYDDFPKLDLLFQQLSFNHSSLRPYHEYIKVYTESGTHHWAIFKLFRPYVVIEGSPSDSDVNDKCFCYYIISKIVKSKRIHTVHELKELCESTLIIDEIQQHKPTDITWLTNDDILNMVLKYIERLTDEHINNMQSSTTTYELQQVSYYLDSQERTDKPMGYNSAIDSCVYYPDNINTGSDSRLSVHLGCTITLDYYAYELLVPEIALNTTNNNMGTSRYIEGKLIELMPKNVELLEHNEELLEHNALFAGGSKKYKLILAICILLTITVIILALMYTVSIHTNNADTNILQLDNQY